GLPFSSKFCRQPAERLTGLRKTPVWLDSFSAFSSVASSPPSQAPSTALIAIIIVVVISFDLIGHSFVDSRLEDGVDRRRPQIGPDRRESGGPRLRRRQRDARAALGPLLAISVVFAALSERPELPALCRSSSHADAKIPRAGDQATVQLCPLMALASSVIR